MRVPALAFCAKLWFMGSLLMSQGIMALTPNTQLSAMQISACKERKQRERGCPSLETRPGVLESTLKKAVFPVFRVNSHRMNERLFPDSQ